MRYAAVLTLALVGLSAAACDRATRTDAASLSAEEARALAAAVDGASAAVVDSRSKSGANLSLADLPGAAADVFTNHGNLSVSRDCPAGGSTSLSGEQTLVIDSDAGTLTLDVTASKAHAACAFRTEQGERITVDGTVSLVAHRALSSAGTASGSQTHEGSLSYTTSSGKSGTCEVDLTSAFDASQATGTATHTINGTVCGRAVDLTSTWTRTG
jgi:hypothetical protein